MSSVSGPHRRGAQSVLTFEENQYLSTTYAVLWYIRAERVERHSQPLCLASHHFQHVVNEVKLAWKPVSFAVFYIMHA